ncbi:hypothetical protein CN445_24390 [Bacillus cereus]|nr:hypothetical protein CN445_24390 [Bacillus cereus]
MVTIDDNTKIAMEVVAQTFKLSEQALLHVLKSLTKLLENKEQPPKDYILDENTEVGKQKINELIKKHDKNSDVIALDENLTRRQLRDYQKELKKLGVNLK